MGEARQFNLVKSRRQRGERVGYAPSEFQLHCTVADALYRWIDPAWLWSHLPFGEHRTAATAGRLARMGVARGWPDLALLSPRSGDAAGRVHFLELKRRSGTRSDDQNTFAAFCERNGYPYACVDNFDAAIAVLRDWGALRRVVKVQ